MNQEEVTKLELELYKWATKEKNLRIGQYVLTTCSKSGSLIWQDIKGPHIGQLFLAYNCDDQGPVITGNFSITIGTQDYVIPLKEEIDCSNCTDLHQLKETFLSTSKEILEDLVVYKRNKYLPEYSNFSLSKPVQK